MQAALLVVVQARMESQRFPGKVLAPLLGYPLLLWHLHALSRVRVSHHLVVACPDTPPNHALAEICAAHGYDTYLHPGDPADVLGRFEALALQYRPASILRTCGDCPLLCPDVVEGVLAAHRSHARPHRRARWKAAGGRLWAIETTAGEPDHTGIGLSWGDGFDCGVFSRQALHAAHTEATSVSDREHCEPFLYTQPQRFRCVQYEAPFDLSWLRLSVDTPEDLGPVATLLAACLDRYGLGYGWADVWQTIERFPALKHSLAQRPINAAYVAQLAQETGCERSWPTLRGCGVAEPEGA